MYPLALHLSGRLVVVIGGGEVGRRKAQGVLDAGAIVRLVALEPPSLVHPGLTWLTEPYQSHHLDGATLVFAAATREVNDRVAADARNRGLLVNRADAPADSDFHVPAVVRRGPLTISVSTGGASPIAAGWIRDQLDQQFGDRYTVWLRLLDELRPIVLRIADGNHRRGALIRLADPGWLERLAGADEATVRAEMLAEVHRWAG